MIQGIRSLTVDSMDLDGRGCSWAAEMMLGNAETLDDLTLGFTTSIAHAFARKSHPRYDEMSQAFTISMKETLSELDSEPLYLHLSLESLNLCGLNVATLVRGEMALDIDFSKITVLRLESCPGLSEAISLLTGQGSSPKLVLTALDELFLRVEDPDANFSASLESFLTSIRGLTHLQVLLDNRSRVQDLEPILSVHGKTLKTLVWDERRGPRTRLDASTSLFSTTRLSTLWYICQSCPLLTILGIPLDWKTLKSSEFYKTVQQRPSIPYVHANSNFLQVRRCLPNLEVLNIRNLPELHGTVVMPMDYFVKGLAAMVVDIMNKRRKTTLIKTIALGAPLYRDISIGTHHIVHTSVSDFLTFCIFNIDYDYPSPSGPSPVLSLIVEGAASNCKEEDLYPTSLIHNYWLG